MHPNAALITRFYEAFQRRDATAMADCYHPDVHFSDPVFDLHGFRAGAMWRMLCERGADLVITFDGVEADDQRGRAHWEARYTFSQTGRKVHNVIDAAFTFRDGKIGEHRDTFDFWRWAGMALGPKGRLLGWLPPVHNAVRKQAARGLEIFIAKNGLAG